MVGALVRRVLGKKEAGKIAKALEEKTVKTKKSVARAPLSFLDTVKNIHGDALKGLDKAIKKHSNGIHSQEPSTSSSSLLTLIHEKCIGENARLIPIGSTVSGLSNSSSDIDVAFYPVRSEERRKFLSYFGGNHDFRETFMKALAQLIVRNCAPDKEVAETVVLSNLRVPLLIVRFKDGSALDINFPTDVYHALRNTNLLRYYALADRRFSMMFLWLRTVCDCLQVRDSKRGLLSSYHLACLLVHFLQSEQSLSPWPVLPVLCKTNPELVGPELPIEQIVTQLDTPGDQLILDYSSKNQMRVSELALRFVDYYSTFDVTSNAIFLDKGLAVRRRQVPADSRLQIIDPYSKVSIARSGYAAKAFVAAMGFTKKRMRNGLMLDSFPEFPEAGIFVENTQFAEWRTYAREKKIL